MRFLRIWLACLMAFSCLLTLSCSQSGGTSNKFKLAFVTNNASDFWTIARKGCER